MASCFVNKLSSPPSHLSGSACDLFYEIDEWYFLSTYLLYSKCILLQCNISDNDWAKDIVSRRVWFSSVRRDINTTLIAQRECSPKTISKYKSKCFSELVKNNQKFTTLLILKFTQYLNSRRALVHKLQTGRQSICANSFKAMLRFSSWRHEEQWIIRA